MFELLAVAVAVDGDVSVAAAVDFLNRGGFCFATNGTDAVAAADVVVVVALDIDDEVAFVVALAAACFDFRSNIAISFHVFRQGQIHEIKHRATVPHCTSR